MKNKITYSFFYVALIIIVLFVSYLIGLYFPYELNPYLFNFNKNLVNNDIIVVAIDDKTINSNDFVRYQDINRSHYAKVLNNILINDPKVVGVDVTFFGQSNNQDDDNNLKKVLDKFGDKVVLVNEVIIDNNNNKKILDVGFGHKNVGYADLVSINLLDITNSYYKNIKNAFPINYSGLGDLIPFSVKVFDIANNSKSYYDENNLYYGNSNKISFSKKGFDNYIFPNFFTDYYETVSFIDLYNFNVLNNSNQLSIFKDKVVFIGATALDIHDIFNTPKTLGAYMPGVFIHANMYNTLSSNKPLYYQGFFDFIFLNLIFITFFVLIVAKSKNMWLGLIYSGLTLILYYVIVIFCFVVFNYFIEIFPILISYLIVNGVIFLFRYYLENKHKAIIQSMFSKYVSKDVVNELIESDMSSLQLGGKQRYVTVFFSDLEGFTSLSEDLNPEQLGKILNVYFEIMTNLILEKGGTVDKYMGDAIMAFWNAPLEVANHEQLACETAILQRKSLDYVRKEIEKYGSGAKIDMRIGINSGEVIVGNFGSSKRFDYTVLGDTVNLGSRLESINKQYGTKIIISENTYSKIDKSKFIIRELDRITVKGKDKPVSIYELIDFDDGSKEEIKAKIAIFENALKLYRDKKFVQAIDLFDQIKDDCATVEIFKQRCELFKLEGVDAHWDGVFKFKVK